LRSQRYRAAAAGDLSDYEAVGQSTVAGLRLQALFAPHTSLTLDAGCAGQTMPPSPRSAAGCFGRSVSEVTPSGRTRLFGLRHSFAGGDRCAGPATSIRHAAHSFGHPPAASRLGYTKVRAGVTGSRWRSRWSRANADRSGAVVKSPRRRWSWPRRVAMARRPGASPSSAPGSCGPALPPPAFCVPGPD